MLLQASRKIGNFMFEDEVRLEPYVMAGSQLTVADFDQSGFDSEASAIRTPSMTLTERQ